MVVLLCVFLLTLFQGDLTENVMGPGEEGSVGEGGSSLQESTFQGAPWNPIETASPRKEALLTPHYSAELEDKLALMAPPLPSIRESDGTVAEGALTAESTPEREPAGEENSIQMASLKSEDKPIVESPATRSGYTVNLASFKKREGADRYVEDLKDQGIEAFVWEVDLPQKGLWHRVSVGVFANREEARVSARGLEGKGFKTFIVKTPELQEPAGQSKPDDQEEKLDANLGGAQPPDEMRRFLRW
jgi:hypothetical protein